jgi:hypothetical protein
LNREVSGHHTTECRWTTVKIKEKYRKYETKDNDQKDYWKTTVEQAFILKVNGKVKLSCNK